MFALSVRSIRFLTYGWIVLVILAHLMPTSGSSVSWMAQYHVDKLVHLLLFLPLGIGLKKGFGFSNWKVVWMVVILAGSLELIQGTVFVGRTTDIKDFCADLIGVILGIVIIKSK